MKPVTLHWSNSDTDWNRWDTFISTQKRGIYLQTRAWLQSYSAYGFEVHLLLAETTEGELIGGLGVVLASAGPFKIAVAPYGPILSHQEETLSKSIVNEFLAFAKRKKAFLAQFSLASSKDVAPNFTGHFLPSDLGAGSISTAKKGLIFKYVTGITAIRAVKLYPDSTDSYAQVRKNYNSSTKRNVNAAAKLGNELHYAETKEELEEAYRLFGLNAKTQGYAIRSWEDFGPTLVQMVARGQCLVPLCVHDGVTKGALIIFDVGQKLHYIMGGTIRDEVDRKVGHFLHDQMIKLGIAKGYDFYDISMGGSAGVVRFKEGFGGDIIGLADPRYWVLKPFQFYLFRKLLPFVQKNKSKIAGILSKLK